MVHPKVYKNAPGNNKDCKVILRQISQQITSFAMIMVFVIPLLGHMRSLKLNHNHGQQERPNEYIFPAVWIKEWVIAKLLQPR